MGWKKGESGNPAGRAKGIGRLVRETVGDDMRAVAYVRRCVALGVPPDMEEILALGVKLTERQREALKNFPAIKASDIDKAAEWVRDTGWHKPRQQIDLEGAVQVGTADLTKMSPAELDEWLAAAERADEESDVEADETPGKAPR